MTVTRVARNRTMRRARRAPPLNALRQCRRMRERRLAQSTFAALRQPAPIALPLAFPNSRPLARLTRSCRARRTSP
ncbi:hypothetical protein WS72_28935 [Burkholderia savannae]|uniref:Uncharacterized protein n=1 Tax=Burkholderia savannae TaxID=1637837 RepID=A0ABR5T9N8_9BURK|nr:hypothetical protein WS72_28935 [Burkholderia savannae]